MEISLTQQCQSFLWALALGAGLSLVYDGFRFLRLLLPERSALIALEDVAYCLLCAVAVMDYALWASQGRLRAYLLLGEGLGWLLWHFSFGELLFRLSQGLARLLQGLGRFLWRRLLHPVARLLLKICAFLLRPLHFVKKMCKKVSIRAKFALKQRAVLLYNLRKSGNRPVEDPGEASQQK